MAFFFFKQKTAYEMRISDWSSDVCSSDLVTRLARALEKPHRIGIEFLADLIDRAHRNERILEFVRGFLLDLAAAPVDAIHRPAADIFLHIGRRRIRNRALEGYRKSGV